MLTIDIISVQPAMFRGFLEESIVARAVKKGLCSVNIVDLREFGRGRWRKVDDKPYGGGPGMLMTCEPWFAAIESRLTPEELQNLGSSKNLVGTPVAVLTTEHTETRVRGTLKAARKRPSDASLTYVHPPCTDVFEWGDWRLKCVPPPPPQPFLCRTKVRFCAFRGLNFH